MGGDQVGPLSSFTFGSILIGKVFATRKQQMRCPEKRKIRNLNEIIWILFLPMCEMLMEENMSFPTYPTNFGGGKGHKQKENKWLSFLGEIINCHEMPCLLWLR